MNIYSLCDWTCLNVMCVYSIPWWSNPKIFLSVLFDFGSDFCYSCFKSFSQNVKFSVLKNLVFGCFATHFTSGCTPIQVVKWFEKISISSQFLAVISRLIRKCFATQIWPLKVCLVHLHISRVACEMCKKSVSKGSNW